MPGDPGIVASSSSSCGHDTLRINQATPQQPGPSRSFHVQAFCLDWNFHCRFRQFGPGILHLRCFDLLGGAGEDGRHRGERESFVP